jgi:hypothetical protein
MIPVLAEAAKNISNVMAEFSSRRLQEVFPSGHDQALVTSSIAFWILNKVERLT